MIYTTMATRFFFDNFFCSIPLLQQLKLYSIEGTGTCCANRLKGAGAKLLDETELKNKGRGSTSVVSTADNITVTRWLDRSLIHIASTCAGQLPEDRATRWKKSDSTLIEITRPFSVALYNRHMEGVDLVDKCLATYAHRRRNKRWYMRIFFHFLDLVCVNAWRLYQKKNPAAKSDLLSFKASIAQGLINAGSMMDRRRGRPSLTTPPKRRHQVNTVHEVRYGIGHHWPRSAPIKNAMRCRFERCSRKTRFICITCQIALCPDCFEGFHSR